MSEDARKEEQKTERFNMFMSPSEMKAIDDWAWKNRIRSKSEAVRRLCQIGLSTSEALPQVMNAIYEINESSADALPMSVEIPPLDGDALQDWLVEYQFATASKHFGLYEQIVMLLHSLNAIYAPIIALSENPKFDDALIAAQDALLSVVNSQIEARTHFDEMRKNFDSPHAPHQTKG